MKSYFLLTLVLLTFTSLVWSQPTSVTRVDREDSFKRFHNRLKIGYFGVLTTPHFDDMDEGNWEYAAISPESSDTSDPKGSELREQKRNRDTWPTNMWNQLSFNYNFGAKMNFVVNPRFMLALSHPVSQKAVEDRSLIQLQDALVGFQGVPFSSADKKFNLWLRPGVRLPTSHFNRNSQNGVFGKMTHELELAYSPTYDFNKKWQVGIFGQIRNWVFEDRYTAARRRFYTAPFLVYTIDDTTKFQVYYENTIENNKRWESINGKKPVYKDIAQDLLIGMAKDVTSSLNLFPYLGVYVNRPLDNKAFWLGAWISYQIK